MSSGRVGTRICLILVVMLVCVVQFAGQRKASDSSFEAIYKRGIELNSGLKTLTAHFTETSTSTILTRPLIASGNVAVQRPPRIVLHYLEPEQRDVLLEDDRMTVSWPSRHFREVTSIATMNRRIQKYFVDATPDRLRDNFDRQSTDSKRSNTYQVTMVPKRKQMKDGLAALDLWIDETSMLLTAMKMTFPNGDTKVMVLDGVVANQPIDPSVFSAAK
jgi:outer membrane lipoprotein-sorting protein